MLLIVVDGNRPLQVRARPEIVAAKPCGHTEQTLGDHPRLTELWRALDILGEALREFLHRTKLCAAKTTAPHAVYCGKPLAAVFDFGGKSAGLSEGSRGFRRTVTARGD